MRIRTRSFIIMASQGLTQATTLILGIILVRMISQQMFGTYRQVGLIYIFFSGVLSLQLGNSLYYFIPKLGQESKRGLIIQTFLLTLIMAVIVGVVMFFSAEIVARMFSNPALKPLIRIYAFYPFVHQLVLLVPHFMISIDRAVRAGVYTLLTSVGRIATVVILFALNFELYTIILMTVIVCGIIAVIGCADILRLSPGRNWALSLGLVTEQLHYAWPLLASAIVGTINFQFDKFLISTFFEPETYAVYSCGAFQLPIVGIITLSVSAAMMPNLVMMIKRGEDDNALDIWQEAARKCSLVIFPVFIFFLVVGYDLIVLFYGRDYSMASWPFRIYLCLLPIRIGIYAALFQAAGNTRPIAIGGVVALVLNIIVSTSLVVIGKGGFVSFIGPSLGTLASTVGAWGYLLWQLTHTMSKPFSQIMRWRELGLLMLVCVFCGIIVFVVPLPVMPQIIKLAVQCLIYGVTFLSVLLLAGILKEDEKQLLRLPLSVARRLLFNSRN